MSSSRTSNLASLHSAICHFLSDVFVPELAYPDFQLSAPGGAVLISGFLGGGPHLVHLPETGTYTLIVSSFAGNSGNYGFRLLPSAGVQSFNYALETLIDSSSAPAGFIDLNGAADEFTFTIDGPPGGFGKYIDFLDHGSTDSKMMWTVEQLTPAYTVMFVDQLDGISPGLLYNYPGQYRIRVFAANSDPSVSGSYSFSSDISYPPIAGGESFRTKINKPLRIPKGRLLSNDYDPDGTPVVWSGFEYDPFLSNGIVEDKGDTLLFTPNPGFTGEAYFWYSIQDTVQWWMTGGGVVTVQVD